MNEYPGLHPNYQHSPQHVPPHHPHPHPPQHTAPPLAHGYPYGYADKEKDAIGATASTLSSANRRGPWDPMEDKRLMELINVFGPTNWVRISQSLGSRTPKQCRERFHQNLKPLLNKTPITPEEGAYIEELVEKYGKKWAEIARHLNGRSDNAVKNWWNGGANRRRRTSAVGERSRSNSPDETPEKPDEKLGERYPGYQSGYSGGGYPGGYPSGAPGIYAGGPSSGYPGEKYPETRPPERFGPEALEQNVASTPQLYSAPAFAFNVLRGARAYSIADMSKLPSLANLPPLTGQPLGLGQFPPPGQFPAPLLKRRTNHIEIEPEPRRRHSSVSSSMFFHTPRGENLPFLGCSPLIPPTSRTSSISHDFSLNDSRRSSLAPDLFPNPLGSGKKRGSQHFQAPLTPLTSAGSSIAHSSLLSANGTTLPPLTPPASGHMAAMLNASPKPSIFKSNFTFSQPKPEGQRPDDNLSENQGLSESESQRDERLGLASDLSLAATAVSEPKTTSPTADTLLARRISIARLLG
ncbi:hypothetical protein BABINDRAFT_162070 [Babjeviella inositovora NRRL Y-12698]|uniref:Uncharacterized protein n=1 Tax=Babjeviella inositovora NRRL Y-12698 TaxID=984486 RepID=A0A1E3QMU6_9ASCO|nr:uncharacterized protein BABINDRAFT_162070 [Babjeviella inositovora NRRL Y-12698]ODQ78991.1 hypothetical protein BABINDRAFT_162070 [Babjeviella inositovora NRRL Y-12698]